MNNRSIRQLYLQTSKHSSYQLLHPLVRGLVGDVGQEINRLEFERLDYITANVNLDRKHCADIGGNTGFFSFAAIESGAASVQLIEGNEPHCCFVKACADRLSASLEVINTYVSSGSEIENADVVFLLNVIHHLGDDFGAAKSTSEALGLMGEYLRTFQGVETLVFQMGYCWKGDRSELLFEGGSKAEMISWVEQVTDGIFEIKKCGIPDQNGVYRDASPDLMFRNDSLGEFIHRPIFILEAV